MANNTGNTRWRGARGADTGERGPGRDDFPRTVTSWRYTCLSFLSKRTMTNTRAAHESRSLFLEGPAGRLEAILWKPAAQARLAALVCHPHPLFGGTMHNKVVYQAAKSLDALGVPVLRFNFRSAGMSGGTHDQGRGEEGDAKAALDFLAEEFPGVPLLVA